MEWVLLVSSSRWPRPILEFKSTRRQHLTSTLFGTCYRPRAGGICASVAADEIRINSIVSYSYVRPSRIKSLRSTKSICNNAYISTSRRNLSEPRTSDCQRSLSKRNPLLLEPGHLVALDSHSDVASSVGSGSATPQYSGCRLPFHRITQDCSARRPHCRLSNWCR